MCASKHSIRTGYEFCEQCHAAEPLSGTLHVRRTCGESLHGAGPIPGARPKSRLEGWKCSLDEQEFKLDAFDCPRILHLTYNAPRGAEPGDHGDCDVAIYATPEGGKPQLIGGVTAQTIIPEPCHFVGTVVGMAGQPLAGAHIVFEIDDPEILTERSKYTTDATTGPGRHLRCYPDAISPLLRFG